MKKRLFIMSNQRGFIMPYVLFITTLIMILVITNIHSYQRDIEITERNIQQLKMETLFQMGRENIKETIHDLRLSESITYKFPDGTVQIDVVEMNDNQVELFFQITTNTNDATYGIKHILPK